MEAEKVAVRRLVEWVLRCGDIDSRYVESDAMQQGAAAHRKIQQAMGGDYRREVSLSCEALAGGIPLLLQGRADGVFTGGDGLITVDEIKSTTLPLDKLRRQEPMHLGQAKCYAVMLLREMADPPAAAAVQLTYCHIETEETQRIRYTFTRDELEAFWADTLDAYGVWLRFERDWTAARNASAAAVPFPFPSYRRGQRELAAAAYRAIAGEKRLYVQAPTGIGKTLSTLFPAVKAQGEGRIDKLFYLTAKTVTRTVAEEAVSLLREAGLRYKAVTLRAKDKLCPCGETICTPDACPYARGHYDRVNQALLHLLEAHDAITPAVVEAYAREYLVCPHELALDAALWADLVIGDYNHVFDPVVYLRRFFDGGGCRCCFLIDEAHNLPDRVRDMYSASLRRTAFSRLPRQLPDKNAAAAALRKAARQVSRYLEDAGKELGEKTSASVREADVVLGALLLLFRQAAEDWLAQEKAGAHPFFHDVLELFFETGAYETVATLYDERFVTLTQREGREVTRTLFCLDPSDVIAARLDAAQSAVLFSATLTPLPYYRELLGGRADDPMRSLPSPFDAGRLLLAAHVGISTKYAGRAASYTPIAHALYAAVSGKTGNYLVFFPSYDYMQQVYERFTAAYPAIDTLLQESRMDEDARAAFLARFDADSPDTLVGFCVMGGIFSEGIDLKGDRLIGSIVVGTGLPGLSLRQEEIRAYYQQKNGRGYDYAYVYPGMNKVLQAAGRVIRSAADYGLVLLIDSRFDTPAYRALFPPHWAGMRYIRTLPQLEEAVASFPYFRDA